MSSDGVVVFSFGPAPIDFLSSASALCGKDAILDTDVARMAGASLAMGSPAALAAMKAKLEDGALAADATTKQPPRRLLQGLSGRIRIFGS